MAGDRKWLEYEEKTELERETEELNGLKKSLNDTEKALNKKKFNISTEENKIKFLRNHELLHLEQHVKKIKDYFTYIVAEFASDGKPLLKDYSRIIETSPLGQKYKEESHNAKKKLIKKIFPTIWFPTNYVDNKFTGELQDEIQDYVNKQGILTKEKQSKEEIGINNQRIIKAITSEHSDLNGIKYLNNELFLFDDNKKKSIIAQEEEKITTIPEDIRKINKEIKEKEEYIENLKAKEAAQDEPEAADEAPKVEEAQVEEAQVEEAQVEAPHKGGKKGRKTRKKSNRKTKKSGKKSGKKSRKPRRK